MASQNNNALHWSWVGRPHDCILADSRRLRQILLNLLGNAVKFTQNGTVDVEVELSGETRQTIEFRVIDTGRGIAEADLKRVFSDFETLDSSYTRQVGGTGLGLGIAQRLTRAMGGEIGVESVLGEGSVFWLRMPIERVDKPEQPEPAVRLRVPQTAREMDLLLVEDNDINRTIARKFLTSRGHNVTEARDGKAGLELALGHCFDAILMDISMPVMDGLEATRRIRAATTGSARSPIIAVTAHALAEERETFRAAGMDHCISKPLNPSKLFAILAEITGTASAPGQPILCVNGAADRRRPS